MKAYIEGIEMMKDIDPEVRIMTTEPLINITAQDPSDPISVLEAHEKHREQFQVLEILTGKLCPELGGKPEYLDIIGVNFYFNNQWTYPDHQFIPWNDTPPNQHWRSLHDLVEEVFINFGRPVVLSETSHPGDDRPVWLKMIFSECETILKSNLPFYGCCIYPIIDRPDWDFPTTWHHSGLWDIIQPQTLERTIHNKSLLVLEDFQKNLGAMRSEIA